MSYSSIWEEFFMPPFSATFDSVPLEKVTSRGDGHGNQPTPALCATPPTASNGGDF
jgi:hypothetical protein